MNDPKVVIGQLAKRWLSQYGETLGTEEIRRHLSRILSELQKREIEQVFANWSGEQLLDAINATFDLDDGQGVVRVKPLEAGLCPPAGVSSEIAIQMREEIADTEYLPFGEPAMMLGDTPIYIDNNARNPVAIMSKHRGRPPGSKNKGKK